MEFMKSRGSGPSQEDSRVSWSLGGSPDAATLPTPSPLSLSHKGLAILPRRDRSRCLPRSIAGMINELDVAV